ncbi:Membrane transport protein [Lachnospiraceae bacterium NE2001]|nr:Membrane transport protein [Lachnospiraceae bacterium NE2001]SEQ99033.1 Membrane transport protein [Lachnospiraceae bacterium NE2001]
MNISIVLQQMGVIAILVSIGIFLYKREVIDDHTSQRMSTIVMDVCNPALILASLLSGNVTATHHDLLIAMVLGVAFYFGLVILGFIFPMIIRGGEDSRFYNMMTVYTNVGFIGIPVARAILPENAILYVIICNVMYCLLFYTHGILVLSNGKEKLNLKKILSPGTIMAVVSLVVFWFDIKLPPIIANSISYLGNATVFLSMTLLGVGIARSKITSGIKNPRIWIYVLVRMLLVPVVLFFALKAAGFSAITIMGLCLMAAMPIGNLPLIQCEKMGEDTELLSGAIAISTLASMFTITLLMSAFTYLLGLI